jgi:hypothetical protein
VVETRLQAPSAIRKHPMKTVSRKSTAPLAAITGDIVKLRAIVLLTILAIGFWLQIFTPLRLNTDAVALLSMAESAAHGGGFLDDGQISVFPPGYPAMLAVLLRLGLAHPWVIVSLNMLFLSLGVYAVFCLLNAEFFKDRTVVIMICCLFLLSYLVVKHSTMPLTEGPFFICSMCCLLFMSKAADLTSNRHFVGLVCAALLSATAAITIRRIGIALVPPLAFTLLRSYQFKSFWKRLSSRSKAVVLIVSGVVVAATVGAFALTSHWRVFISDAKERYRIVPLSWLPWFRLKEFGELFVNFPVYRMPAALQRVVPWMGFPLFLLLVAGLAIRRRQISPTDVFIVCYAIIVFAWPYYDARFWWPVIPLLIAYSQLAVQRCKIPTAIVRTYCVWFAILGFGAIAYSTRITFSGCEFPARYGSGDFSPTYRAAFGSCRENADPGKVDARVLRLLREYR